MRIQMLYEVFDPMDHFRYTNQIFMVWNRDNNTNKTNLYFIGDKTNLALLNEIRPFQDRHRFVKTHLRSPTDPITFQISSDMHPLRDGCSFS